LRFACARRLDGGGGAFFIAKVCLAAFWLFLTLAFFEAELGDELLPDELPDQLPRGAAAWPVCP
jgi:hypothetical protein